MFIMQIVKIRLNPTTQQLKSEEFCARVNEWLGNWTCINNFECCIEYTYEENRRIIREIEPGEPEILITEAYDAAGRLLREIRSNGHYTVTEQHTYDDAGNRILKETFDGTVLVESRRADYDRDGRVTAEEIMMNHPHQQGRMARRYEYDIEGRVTAIYGTHGAQRMEYHGY